MVESYPDGRFFLKEDQIELLLKKFPEGQLNCCRWNCRGSALSLLVTEDFAFKTRNKAITGNFTFSTHNPDGEVLYGIDVLLIHNTEVYD
jgi:hypothetical protein